MQTVSPSPTEPPQQPGPQPPPPPPDPPRRARPQPGDQYDMEGEVQAEPEPRRTIPVISYAKGRKGVVYNYGEKVKENFEDMCVVCLLDYDPDPDEDYDGNLTNEKALKVRGNPRLIELPCGHLIYEDCLRKISLETRNDTWGNVKCPKCRQGILPLIIKELDEAAEARDQQISEAQGTRRRRCKLCQCCAGRPRTGQGGGEIIDTGYSKFI